MKISPLSGKSINVWSFHIRVIMTTQVPQSSAKTKRMFGFSLAINIDEIVSRNMIPFLLTRAISKKNDWRELFL